jgi:hypothetical protein
MLAMYELFLLLQHALYLTVYLQGVLCVFMSSDNYTVAQFSENHCCNNPWGYKFSAMCRAIIIGIACTEANCSSTGCSTCIHEFRINFILSSSESSWCNNPRCSNHFSYLPSYSYC